MLKYVFIVSVATTLVIALAAIAIHYSGVRQSSVHLSNVQRHLAQYQRFAQTVDASAVARNGLEDLDVPGDLRAIGVIHIAAGYGSVVFQLPTDSWDSDEAVLYLPVDENVYEAAPHLLNSNKIRSVERLSSRWYFVQYE
jgi:hypothetical protein